MIRYPKNITSEITGISNVADSLEDNYVKLLVEDIIGFDVHC